MKTIPWKKYKILLLGLIFLLVGIFLTYIGSIYFCGLQEGCWSGAMIIFLFTYLLMFIGIILMLVGIIKALMAYLKNK